MLITFKSANNADLIMLEASGKEILALLGKNPEDTRGIITVEQLPEAISILQKAVVAAKAILPEQNINVSDIESDYEQPVSLPPRAAPSIEMLKRALKAGEPVVWGV